MNKFDRELYKIVYVFGIRDKNLDESLEKMKSLLELGADPNLCNSCSGGRLVTKIAGNPSLSQENTIRALNLLIDYGANVRIGDKDFPKENTALSSAVCCDKFDVAKFLIEKGAPVNCDHKDLSNCSLFADVYNRLDANLAKTFIRAGVDVNGRGYEGQTALMNASKYGNIEKIKLLVEAGADVNMKDNAGKNALDYAETEELKILLSKGEKKTENEEIKQHIERRKSQILKSRKLRQRIEKQNPMAKVSDAALVDEIARNKISGKEQRTITPEIGAEIKRRKAFEK